MTTITPYRSTEPAGPDGFGQILHAEWTKFRTVRGWVAGMMVAIFLVAGLGVLVAVPHATSQALGQSSGGPPASATACPAVSPAVGPGGEPVNDQFYFVRQPLAGNGSLTVRLTSLTGLLPSAGLGDGPSTQPGLVPWSKAGIIVKDGICQGSAYAAMMATGGNGVRMQWNYTGDTPGLPGAVSAASPRWLRLTRDGDTITGSDSADGTHWTRVGTVTLAGLPSIVQAGLFATSPSQVKFAPAAITGGGGFTSGPSQDTAVFDQVTKSGAWPASTWTGSYIGGGSAAMAKDLGGYHQASGRFTVRGSGDIAPIVDGPANGAGYGQTITGFLVGTFVGLIAVAVVATLFMTGEYRRGLIRTTLAASPRRVRVLAAKAIVIGSVAFVTGLAAAACAVVLGVDISRNHTTSLLFPVPWPTELRVIAGTAALVAVVAILTLAVATIVRRAAAAVMIVIAAVVVPYFLSASVLPALVANWVLRITPAAAFALQQPATRYPQVQYPYSPGTGFYPLAPWAGFAVLCAWTAIALGVAAYLLQRRDA